MIHTHCLKITPFANGSHSFVNVTALYITLSFLVGYFQCLGFFFCSAFHIHMPGAHQIRQDYTVIDTLDAPLYRAVN